MPAAADTAAAQMAQATTITPAPKKLIKTFKLEIMWLYLILFIEPTVSKKSNSVKIEFW